MVPDLTQLIRFEYRDFNKDVPKRCDVFIGEVRVAYGVRTPKRWDVWLTLPPTGEINESKRVRPEEFQEYVKNQIDVWLWNAGIMPIIEVQAKIIDNLKADLAPLTEQLNIATQELMAGREVMTKMKRAHAALFDLAEALRERINVEAAELERALTRD